VSNQLNSLNEYRLPFSCEKQIIPSVSLPQYIFDQLSNLLHDYRIHPKKIDLNSIFKTRFASMTKLEKMITSLEGHVALSNASLSNSKIFVSKIRDIVERGFL
jgi:protein MYSM1